MEIVKCLCFNSLNLGMEKDCNECGNAFILKKKYQDRLIFIEPDKYICMDCYDERVNSEYRILSGIYLCVNSKCARNRMAFSDFCEICDREFL